MDFALNFDQRLTATPGEFGLDASDAAAFHTLYLSTKAAYDLGVQEQTRTKANIAAKDNALAEMTAEIRRLSRIVQAAPGVTDHAKIILGLPVHDSEPTPKPVPTVAPVLIVRGVNGWTVDVQLKDALNLNSRSKPANVDGAIIFGYLGETAPPPGAPGWEFQTNTKKTRNSVTFPTTLEPGTKVWLTAFWYNPRGESGPACAPVSTFITAVQTEVA